MNRNKPKILHLNNYGYIAQCTCCGELQLCFMGTILNISEKEFHNFNAFFDRIRNSYEAEIDTGCQERKYIIKFEENKMSISFTYHEMGGVIELVNSASIMLSVGELLKM